MERPEERFRHRLALAMGWSLGQVEALPAAEYARWELYDLVYGLPDPNAYQAHVCQTILAALGGRRVKLGDLMLRPGEARRLSAEETVGFMSRGISPATARPEHPANPGGVLS